MPVKADFVKSWNLKVRCSSASSVRKGKNLVAPSTYIATFLTGKADEQESEQEKS